MTVRVKRKSNQMLRKKRIWLIVTLAFPVAHFLVFWVYLNVRGFLLPFISTAGKWNDFAHFKWLWENVVSEAPYWDVLVSTRNALMWWAFGMFVMLPVSIMVSYFIYKKIKGGEIFKVILFLPSIISGSIMAVVFKNFIDMDGPLTVIYSWIFKQPMPYLLDTYPNLTMLIFSFWTAYGMNVILYTGSMSRIPVEVLESAKLDGIKPFRELISIIMPLIWPMFCTSVLLNMVGIFSASGPILLFTRGQNGSNTISFAIYQQYNEYNQVSRAAAIHIVFAALSVPFVIISRFLTKRIEEVSY